MRIIFLFGFIFLLNLHSYTQTANRNHAFAIELGKNGLIYNLAYDQKFKNNNFGFRLNAGSNFSKHLNAIVAGGGGFYLIGKTRDFLELGLDLQYLTVDEVSDDQQGVTLLYPDYSIKTYYVSVNFGYRRFGKKDLIRIGFSPGWIKDGFVPGGYMAWGLRF